MFSKFIKGILVTTLAIGLFTFQVNSVDAATKVIWGKTELKLGQIGKVTVQKDTHLYKIIDSKTISSDRKLKKGEEFRVYNYKNQNGGLYGVGGGMFILNDKNIKYETPSKSKLAQLIETTTNVIITSNGKDSEFTDEEIREKFNKVVPDSYEKYYSEGEYFVSEMLSEDEKTPVFSYFHKTNSEVRMLSGTGFKNHSASIMRYGLENEEYKSMYIKFLREININLTEKQILEYLDQISKTVTNSMDTITIEWDNVELRGLTF